MRAVPSVGALDDGRESASQAAGLLLAEADIASPVRPLRFAVYKYREPTAVAARARPVARFTLTR